MSPVLINVPGIPVAKGRPRFTTRGGFARAYTPKKTGDYERFVRGIAVHAMDGRAPLEGPLSVSVVAHLPRPKSWSKAKRAATQYPTSKPDADNFGKIALDSLNGLVFHDDAQVVTLACSKRFAEVPCLVIHVEAA